VAEKRSSANGADAAKIIVAAAFDETEIRKLVDWEK
jgi:hypothetical protein